MQNTDWLFLIQDRKKTHKLPPAMVYVWGSESKMARLQVDRRFPNAMLLMQLEIRGLAKWGQQFVTLHCGKDKYHIVVEPENYFFNTLMTAYREMNPERSCKEFVYDLVQARVFTMFPESHAFSITEHWR